MKSATASCKSVLAQDIRRYVLHKRALGRKYDTEDASLRLLDRYLCEQYVNDLAAVDPAVIEAFLASRNRRSARSYNHLLGVIRHFFAWLVVQERIEHSPVRVGPRRTRARRQPFLFDPPLAERLLALARALPDRPKGPNRGATYRLIFAMMYTLGLRVGEVSRLRREDVDLNRHVLSVRQTKFAKDRLVPFGPRLAGALAEYIDNREHRSGRFQADDPLFSFNAGRPVHPCTITQTFHHLVSGDPAFAPPPGVTAPRLHCLRHSFAVGTLLLWYRAGIDVGQRLIHLSTFLGHADPESTAWYLTITEELLEEANERFERFATPGLGEEPS
jgi:site-specific recombinase XerD